MGLRQTTTREKGPPSSRVRAGKARAPAPAEAAGTHVGPAEPPGLPEHRDRVERESDQSFPASDPPGWIASWSR